MVTHLRHCPALRTLLMEISKERLPCLRVTSERDPLSAQQVLLLQELTLQVAQAPRTRGTRGTASFLVVPGSATRLSAGKSSLCASASPNSLIHAPHLLSRPGREA